MWPWPFRWGFHNLDAIPSSYVPDSCGEIAITHNKAAELVCLNAEHSLRMCDASLLFKCGSVIDDNLTRSLDICDNGNPTANGYNDRGPGATL